MTEIKNAVNASGLNAQYDEKAKRLLSNKAILAHILVEAVDEFRGMEPEEAIRYIEGEPLAGIVPLEPGLTNTAAEKEGRRVVGMNTEDSEINEGLIRFDVIFYVRMKDGISQVIVNLEAQKDEPSGYGILNRAVFYVCRLIASQKERDFVKSNYDDIKRVFSIWVCMNMDEDSLAYIHLTKEDWLGSCQWKGRLDLLNIVMVGITDGLSGREAGYGLHRLLGTLLSKKLPANEKLEILQAEYKISVDDNIRKDVWDMCNLSQGIQKEGEAIGEARGEIRGENKLILNMYKKGYPLEQIADVAEKSIEDIKAIIAEA